ncbi:peroxisomal membrane protein pex14 [Yamadazyma tenuis]|uniref:Peroxisomal membrane protein PEX14 n=1 Tax=Candida tenuis (strain ATCC 10573 / BCRC 21748 / CBS 615 / JCM 9827 / NBRC 10315 / NRRL Y-1498 / VKM Y-70) TaxID=590646 RepID=G3B0C9_CANTC|nr:uncharacterized protein CANTEDRAFT_119681 [Yamadazyma tenuis ATCC 10573]EGV65367.1 hypothetical protein CANTEDRAFT_119681 [Yamadazyma tenuis ATCC 10573]WEJ94967.1 peroxisomal membrane protein pex14 [Yamadazyma tenuis]
MNEDLVQSAVSFLKDPNVTSSPLNKKVEFLQTKGLNEQEIEEALNRANASSNPSTSIAQPSSVGSSAHTHAPASFGPPIDYYNVPPAIPDRTWKDYFIMATATAGVTYGLYQVVSRYVIPSLIPPTQSSIDADKQQIDEEFVKIDKLLEQLASEQKEIKQSNEEKLSEIDDAINNVNDFLTKYNKDKLVFDDDLRLMKLEIDNLKNSVEKNLNLTKDNVKDDLSNINEELISLKNLIKLRSSKDIERKITPVSSIPSASEILKKAKKSVPAAIVTQEPPTVQQATEASPVPVPAPAPAAAPKENGVRFSEATSLNGVTAGGIPEWQMKHKLKEQEQMEQEKVIKDTIDNVGVPAWQLNQS